MKRRDFFQRLLAGGVGIAIAPRIAAEIAKEEPIDEINEFTITDLDEGISIMHKDLRENGDRLHMSFSGEHLMWNDQGELICELNQGYQPRVNDIVWLQPLWDSNDINIPALVTAIVGTDSPVPRTIHLTTLDAEASRQIVSIVEETTWWGSRYLDHVNPEFKNLKTQFAYRAMIFANVFLEEPGFRYVDPRQYPMTYEEAYPKTTGGIWPHLERFGKLKTISLYLHLSLIHI